MSEHVCSGCKAPIDLAAAKLVPVAHLTAERAKTAAEADRAAGLEKKLADSAKMTDLAIARLTLAGDAAPSERDTKMLRAAWQAGIEGMDKPPTFEEWGAGDGKALVSSIRPAAGTPAPAPAPGAAGAAPAPVPAPAPAPPNTSTNTVTAPAPAAMDAAAFNRAQNALLARYNAAKSPAERDAIGVEFSGLEQKYLSGGAGAT